jgi:dienelactone hydrolase
MGRGEKGFKRMTKPQLDTLAFSQSLYQGQKQTLAFKSGTAAQTRQWQKTLRTRLIQLIGGFPKTKVPLSPRLLARKRFKDYTRETILFQSRRDLTVFGYFLLPTGFRAPGPCVICLPGHGRGVDSICGIDGNDKSRPFGNWGEYQQDFALQCVAQGYAVFALEQLGFGHRRDKQAVLQGKEASSCQPSAGAALLFGQTMVGWRVWDVMRALDYLETRLEVDTRRLAVMGISGGGTVALFSAALDPRLKAAVLSCSFNTFKDSIMSISHCIDNYVPGILETMEMPDLAGLIAPRALFVESGAKDPIFPVSASRSAYQKTKNIFKCLKAEDHLGAEVFKGAHRFWGKKAFKFLKNIL